MNSISPASTLIEEQEALKQFISVLQEEQACLLAEKADELPSLLQKKAEVIANIGKLTQSRYDSLTAIPLDGSEDGMQFWIATKGTKTDDASYKELLSLASAAKNLNRLNGLLISKHLSHNQQVLDSVQNVLGSGKFYGPDGQSSVKTRGRELGIG